MMTISSATGTNNSNMQAAGSHINRQTDSVSKNIQNQIANKQKQLQELSSNEKMSLEEKMKKRQEIQQEITTLNQQLRQHQIEQRKEQQSKGSSMEDMLGSNQKVTKSAKQGNGLSQSSMQAMISADSSMKQAKVQGSVAAQLEGKAGVLESEIKMDQGRGVSTKKKEEELADVQSKAQATTASQISTLANANKVMEEAAKEEETTQTAENKKNKTDKTQQVADNKEMADKAIKQTADTSNINVNNRETVSATKEPVTVEVVAVEALQTATQSMSYTSIDVRL